jgi:hypothetical protein
MRQILVNNTEKWRATSQIKVKELIERPPSTRILRYNNPNL